MTLSPHLATTDANRVRTLTLSRPERRNALDTALAQALLDQLRSADCDASVGAVVIAAVGTVFCAGADLSEFKGSNGSEGFARRGEVFLALQIALEEVGVPVVCAIAGPAVGLGASIGIAADLTVMGESATLSWPELAHGMVPSLAMVPLLHRTGRKAAWHLLALGHQVGASQAIASGLVTEVVADATVNARAHELALTLAQRKGNAYRTAKAISVETATLTVAEGLRRARIKAAADAEAAAVKAAAEEGR